MPRNRWQFRVKHLLILTTVLVAGLIGLRLWEHRFVVHWVGGYDLTVTLVGDPGTTFNSIDAYPLANDFVLEGFKVDQLEGGGSPERVTLAADNSFRVYITTYGTTSSRGRELDRYQPQYLGVVLTLEDGTSRRLWVELPDGRESKEVELNLTP